jgi:rod shape determining protein RodA
VKLTLPINYLSVFKTSTRGRWDKFTPLALIGLATFGVFFIYSAQLSVSGSNWITQLVWLIGGVAVYVAVSLIDYRFWLSVAHWLYLLALLPLLFVLLPGIGSERYGATRWLDFGFFAFQPSETAKVAVLLITASLLIRSEIGTVRQSLGVLGKLALAVGLPMVLILLQPDLKSAIVLPPMVFSMLYVSKLSARFFAGALGAFLLIVTGARSMGYLALCGLHGVEWLLLPTGIAANTKPTLVPLHDYQRNRIISFVAPDKIDPMGIGWNQRQSLISVGSGGLTGKGWTEGTQAQLGYLPRSVAHNDFIFSVIAEEKGLSGKLHGPGPVWDSVVQRHPHRRSREGPPRHCDRHRRHGAVRRACVCEHRHDHRAGAYHGHTASLH